MIKTTRMITAAVLTAAMLLSLTGCFAFQGSKDNTAEKTSVTTTQADNQPTVEAEATAGTYVMTTEFGTISESVYTSDIFDFSLSLAGADRVLGQQETNDYYAQEYGSTNMEGQGITLLCMAISDEGTLVAQYIDELLNSQLSSILPKDADSFKETATTEIGGFNEYEQVTLDSSEILTEDKSGKNLFSYTVSYTADGTKCFQYNGYFWLDSEDYPGVVVLSGYATSQAGLDAIKEWAGSLK